MKHSSAVTIVADIRRHTHSIHRKETSFRCKTHLSIRLVSLQTAIQRVEFKANARKKSKKEKRITLCCVILVRFGLAFYRYIRFNTFDRIFNFVVANREYSGV